MAQRLLTLILAVAPRKGLGQLTRRHLQPPDLLPAQPSPGQRAPRCPQALCLCSPLLFCSKTRAPTPEGGHPRLGPWHSALGGPPMTSSTRPHTPAHTPHSVYEGPGMSSTFPHLVFLKHTLTFLALWPLLEPSCQSSLNLQGPGWTSTDQERACVWCSWALSTISWLLTALDYDTAPSFTHTAVGGHPPVPASSFQQPVSWWPSSREAHLHGSLLEQTLVSCVCIPGDHSPTRSTGRGPKTEQRIAGYSCLRWRACYGPVQVLGSTHSHGYKNLRCLGVSHGRARVMGTNCPGLHSDITWLAIFSHPHEVRLSEGGDTDSPPVLRTSPGGASQGSSQQPPNPPCKSGVGDPLNHPGKWCGGGVSTLV